MKYVLDASVAFKWVVPELHTDKAVLLRDDFRNAIHDLLTADFFPVEIAHGLTRAERQKRIQVAQAGNHENGAAVDPHPATASQSNSAVIANAHRRLRLCIHRSGRTTEM